MADIWEIYSYIKGPWSVFWQLFRDKPAETFTAIGIFIGLLIDRIYRKKKAKIEVVKYTNRTPGENVAQTVDFRIMNTGGQEIHFRCYGVITPEPVFDDHENLRYESGFNDEKERLLPGEAVRQERYTFGKDKLLGVYVIDQTGKKWERYLSLKNELWHHKYKLTKRLDLIKRSIKQTSDKN